MINKVYLDLDGVLVDFDTHYRNLIGPIPERNDPNRDVDHALMSKLDFFETAPVMDDAYELFDFVQHLNPIILTGVPKVDTEKASKAKREWVARYFGPGIPVITCRSRDKCIQSQPGSVLVDDWTKYKGLWTAKGGSWVTHTTASNSIEELKKLGVSPFKERYG